MPHFCCPIFQFHNLSMLFFQFLFPMPFLPFTVFLHRCYSVCCLIYRCEFFRCLNFRLAFFSAFTLVLIFTSFPHFSCPIFALPIFQLPFSVAVFAFHRCCYLSSTSLLYDLLPCLLVPIFLLPKFSFHVFVWLHRCSCFLCRKILLPKFFIDQL